MRLESKAITDTLFDGPAYLHVSIALTFVLPPFDFDRIIVNSELGCLRPSGR